MYNMYQSLKGGFSNILENHLKNFYIKFCIKAYFYYGCDIMFILLSIVFTPISRLKDLTQPKVQLCSMIFDCSKL